MRILLDECVDFAVCKYLIGRGYKTSHVTKTKWKGLSNSTIIREAGPNVDIFITTDSDFEVRPANFPVPDLGVIFVRVEPSTG